MSDDRIQIDPEFRSTSTDGTDRSRLPGRYVGAAGFLAVVALLWLFSAQSRNSDDVADSHDVAAAVTTTAPAPVTTTTVTQPPVRDVPTPVYVRGGVPLGALVPGFTDTITMLATPPDNFYVMTWNPDMTDTEVVLTTDRHSPAWGSGSPEGLDASGRWFAEIGPGEVLGIYDVTRRLAVPEPVALRVSEAVWHDSEPGRIAWLACSRDGETQGLMVLDVEDGFVDPQEVRVFEDGCSRWLHRWGNWGTTVVNDQGDTELLTVEGVDRHLDADVRILEGSPTGATLQIVEEVEEGDVSPRIYIVSRDGEQRTAIQNALVPYGWPLSVEWSPDGLLIAIWMVDVFDEGDSSLMVVDAVAGKVTKTFLTGNPEIEGTITWSTDGRFLLFQDVNDFSNGYKLRFYDTETGTTTGAALYDIVDEFRVAALGTP